MEKQDIDALLEALINGKWHILEQIVQRIGIEGYEAKLVISFLQQFQFIQIDKENGKIKLSALTRQFLEKLEPNEASSFYEEMIA